MPHRILMGCYREWAQPVFDYVARHPRVSYVEQATTNAELLNRFFYSLIEFDFVLLCGWSWQPDKFLTDNISVFSEHPIVGDETADVYSPGTPLQNQILQGITEVKHRLVKVGYPELVDRQYSHEVDMSLSGSMDDILLQMQATSIVLFDKFLTDYPRVTWKQWPAVPASQQKPRRTPDMSVLSQEQLSTMTTKQLYDFCRMLEGPYPRAQVEDKYGVLTFEKVSYKSKI